MTPEDKQLCRQALSTIKELVELLEKQFQKQMSAVESRAVLLSGQNPVASNDTSPGSAGAKLAELAAAAKQNLQR